MKNDRSFEWFDRYFRQGRKHVKITLRNGSTMTGHFSGFFYGDTDRGESFIYRWRFNPDSEQEFDYDKTIIPDSGIILLQDEISNVELLSDGSERS
ncbi:MAG: hypothetical protein L6Q81_13620 [Bacteroidia bacterium]|nr:hypothetical protein [Bacteroidia bacterium]